MKLIEKLTNETAGKEEILLFSLGQAGFLLKTNQGKTIAIDAYLSDAAERLFGFKRMTPAVITPQELEVDYYLSTHSHVDHLDIDALPFIASNDKTFFIGSPDCEAVYRENGITPDRYRILGVGDTYESPDLRIRAIFADHGDLAPDSVGLLVETGGIKIYHTGDTAFAPEKIAQSLRTNIEVMIAPINKQFGNMNAREMCQLAEVLKPDVLIACHFWMFLEHVGEGGVGDPAAFLQEAKSLPTSISPIVLAPGEMLKYRK